LSDGYLREVRTLCNELGALLIIDDVQAGMGRTGQWFSWHDRGIEPDIATSAKALANGLPIGACLATEAVAASFRPGDHGTTFGGGPVVCAAALAVIAEIENRDLLANCRARSQQLSTGLREVKGVSHVRGRGLLLAAVLESSIAPRVAEAALAAGLIVNAVRPDAIRLIPPLTISSEEVELAVELFAKSLVSVDG
jgi:acetylornithine aminotransferase